MHKVEATCICQCGIEMDGRSIWVVMMNEGKLGVFVKTEDYSLVHPIESSAPGISQANAPQVILGMMGLLAAAPTLDQPTLVACFETALVMTIVSNEKEQREMLSCIYDEETTQLIITSAWVEALRFMTQELSETDRKLVTDLCVFSFCDTSTILQ